MRCHGNQVSTFGECICHTNVISQQPVKLSGQFNYTYLYEFDYVLIPSSMCFKALNLRFKTDYISPPLTGAKGIKQSGCLRVRLCVSKSVCESAFNLYSSWMNWWTVCPEQYVGNIAREGVQNMHHWSGAIDDATDKWLPQWRHDTVDPLRSQSLFQFVPISDAYFVQHLLH